MRVVLAVLVDPPAEAQADEQVTRYQAEDVVDPLRPRDLLVAAVVTEERDLGKRESHDRGDDGLVPRIAYPDERPPRRGVATERDCDTERVTPAAALEQAGGLDLAGQAGEFAARAGGRCSGHRRTVDPSSGLHWYART